MTVMKRRQKNMRKMKLSEVKRRAQGHRPITKGVRMRVQVVRPLSQQSVCIPGAQ